MGGIRSATLGRAEDPRTVHERAGIAERPAVANLLNRHLALVGEVECGLQVKLGDLVGREAPLVLLDVEIFGHRERLLEPHHAPVAAGEVFARVEPAADPLPLVLVGDRLMPVDLGEKLLLLLPLLQESLDLLEREPRRGWHRRLVVSEPAGLGEGEPAVARQAVVDRYGVVRLVPDGRVVGVAGFGLGHGEHVPVGGGVGDDGLHLKLAQIPAPFLGRHVLEEKHRRARIERRIGGFDRLHRNGGLALGRGRWRVTDGDFERAGLAIGLGRLERRLLKGASAPGVDSVEGPLPPRLLLGQLLQRFHAGDRFQPPAVVAIGRQRVLRLHQLLLFPADESGPRPLVGGQSRRHVEVASAGEQHEDRRDQGAPAPPLVPDAKGDKPGDEHESDQAEQDVVHGDPGRRWPQSARPAQPSRSEYIAPLQTHRPWLFVSVTPRS